jgi:glyoxylase-like metal-dependent hydrolase (beta-lactamase superfamily II)
MKILHKNVYVHTTSDGLNVGCIVGEDGAVSIDLPLRVDEALQWQAQINELTPRPLRAIIFTSPDRVNSDALKALAPNLGAFSVPTIIQDAGFNQLYAALEAAQPRMLEPLSPVQLREQAVLPDMTFSDSATFTLGLEDPIRIDFANAGGYAPGSAIVTVRDTGVAFVGWLAASHEPPLMLTANLETWMSTLSALKRNRKVKVIVPASGPTGDPTILTQTLNYLKAVNRGVKKLLRTHKPRENVAGLVPELLALFMAGRSSTPSIEQEVMAQRIQASLERIYDELSAAPASEPAVEA